MANNQKILFIPGWLDYVEIHGFSNSLNIWQHNIDFRTPVMAQYIVAHSIGAALALSQWEQNNSLSLILVNPLIEQDHLFKRWIRFIIQQGTPITWRRFVIIICHFWSSLIKLKKLLQIKQLDILQKIPQAQLLIIRGQNDHYLCPQTTITQLKNLGIKNILELANINHNWQQQLNTIIAEYIDKNTISTH